MEKEFLDYTEALALKELGFDEPCLGYFDCERDFKFIFNKQKFLSCEAATPTYRTAFRWFREKHGWISNVWTICISTDGITSFEYAIDTLNDLGVSQYRENFPYKTYEEAELECLKNLIEIVKEKQL
jgi:hypothetical protein